VNDSKGPNVSNNDGLKVRTENGRHMSFISVIVPVTERPAPLAALYEEYSRPFREAGIPFEFVFALALWNQRLAADLQMLIAQGEPIQVVQAGQSGGESTLLRLAGERASADILLTLPAYRRIVPAELLRVVEPVLQGIDLAVARRWPRQDSWLNRLQNRAFHTLLRFAGGFKIRDVACGVLAIRREVFEALPLYGDFHRFLPILALRDGYIVEEVNTEQHVSDRRGRVYSPGVYLRRVLDLLGLFFLVRFTEKPLRFFGLMGTVSAFTGALLLGVLLVQRIQGQGIADRPLLLLGTLLVVLGVQAIALGLVGEIVVHLHAPQRQPYRLIPIGPSQASVDIEENERTAATKETTASVFR
jgi:hypothetical protein